MRACVCKFHSFLLDRKKQLQNDVKTQILETKSVFEASKQRSKLKHKIAVAILQLLSPSRNAFDLNHISLLVQHQLLLVTMTSSSKSDFNSVRLGVSGKINNSSVVLRWLSG